MSTSTRNGGESFQCTLAGKVLITGVFKKRKPAHFPFSCRATCFSYFIYTCHLQLFIDWRHKTHSMSELGGFLFGNLDETGKLENEEWDDEIRQSLSLLSGKVSGMSLVGMNSLGITTTDIQSTETGMMEEMEPIPMNRGSEDYSVIDLDEEEEVKGDKDKHIMVGLRSRRTVGFTLLYSLSKIKKYTLKRVRFRKKALNAKILVYAEDESEQFERQSSARRWRERFSMSVNALVMSMQNVSMGGGGSKKKPSKVQASMSEAMKAYAESPAAPVPQSGEALRSMLTLQELHPLNLLNWEDYVIFDEAQAAAKGMYPMKTQLAQLYSDARHAEANLPLSAPTARPPSRGVSTSLGGKITVSAIASGTVSASAAAAALSVQRRTGPMSQPTSPTSPTSVPFTPLRNIATRIVNVDLEAGAWEDFVIFDETAVAEMPSAKLVLNMNDPSLIFEAVELDNRKLNRAEKLIAKRLRKLRSADQGARLVIGNYSKPLGDKYNLSNDKLYDAKAPMVIRSGKHKQSANAIGRMSLQHSVPALKLLPPHFKTTLDKSELRQWHRPMLHFPTNVNIGFSATKALKKTTAMSGRLNQVIRKTKDLTLRDGSPAVLLEYTEREPMLLMNAGMATFMYLYYRKRDAKDEYVPEDEIGFGAVLDVNDPSPFWIYGDVPPGQQMYAVQNNLFRAALGKQEAARTDFLCLRYAHKGRVQYFMRPMPTVLSVGQVLPSVDVYNPHSRKFLNYARKRVQVAAYRLFHKDALSKRLRIGRILTAFPQFSEGSIRKWLKEYAESQRGGHASSGLWFLKADAPRLGEEDVRGLVTPEMACVYEAMLVGQQRLVDQGYHLEGDSVEDNENPEESDDPQLRTAPWNLTANALLASEGKLLLQVTGGGAGRINFQRDKREENPGKGTRPRSGELLLQHKAKLQQTWRAMLAQLSTASAPLTDDDDVQEEEEDSKSMTSMGSSTVTGRKLVIHRVRVDAQGNRLSISETVTDARVISQYLRRQQELAIKRKRRANANKASQAPKKRTIKSSGSSSGVVREKKVKEQANVRCGACGAYGHMRTNRICPMFNASPEEQSAAPVKVEGGKLTISIGSLKKVAEERSKSLLFKLPTKVLASSGTSTPPTVEVRKKPRKLAPWQRILELMPEHRPLLESFNRGLSRVVGELKAEGDSWPFHRPVNKRQYPLYYKIVQKPVDLQTIGMAATKLKYTSTGEFMERVELMGRNCRQYNGEEHAFTRTVLRLVDMARERCEPLKDLEGKLQAVLANNNNTSASTLNDEGEAEVEDVVIDDDGDGDDGDGDNEDAAMEDAAMGKAAMEKVTE